MAVPTAIAQILPITPQRAVLQDRDAPQPPPFLPAPTICSACQEPADAKQATTDEGVLREDAFLRLKAGVLKAFNIHRDNLAIRTRLPLVTPLMSGAYRAGSSSYVVGQQGLDDPR